MQCVTAASACTCCTQENTLLRCWGRADLVSAVPTDLEVVMAAAGYAPRRDAAFACSRRHSHSRCVCGVQKERHLRPGGRRQHAPVLWRQVASAAWHIDSLLMVLKRITESGSLLSYTTGASIAAWHVLACLAASLSCMALKRDVPRTLHSPCTSRRASEALRRS